MFGKFDLSTGFLGVLVEEGKDADAADLRDKQAIKSEFMKQWQAALELEDQEVMALNSRVMEIAIADPMPWKLHLFVTVEIANQMAVFEQIGERDDDSGVPIFKMECHGNHEMDRMFVRRRDVARWVAWVAGAVVAD